MAGIARLTLLGSLLCFIVYFTNVAFGAAGRPLFLGDIGEMLLLLLSATLFVAGVLCREAVENVREENVDRQGL